MDEKYRSGRYIVPQELKSPTKVNKYIYLYDFIFMFSYFIVMSAMGSGVHDSMKIFFYIYNLVVGFLLTRPTRYNPQKRMYQSLFYKLIKDRTVYHGCESSEGKELLS